MNEQRFWNLRHPESDAKEAEYGNGMDWEGIKCPVNDEHQRAGRRITDLRVELRGRTVEDFVWTFFCECLVQDRVLDIFRANNVTGFEVKPKPVKIAFKRKRDYEPPRLWELVVTGWAGMAAPDSGIKLTERCDACGLLKYGGCTSPEKLIDSAQWDGSDIFMVWPLVKFIFVTDRVARLLRKNRFSGFVLNQPADLDFSPSDTLGGGRLSYWMPDARAHELGEPLGIY
jgi:hypothetical protein